MWNGRAFRRWGAGNQALKGRLTLRTEHEHTAETTGYETNPQQRRLAVDKTGDKL
jgi:hypothetical protein